jgi:hypothetical protein
LLGLFLRVLVRFMMTDDAADTGAKNGVMAGDPTYGRTLQATGRMGGRGRNI